MKGDIASLVRLVLWTLVAMLTATVAFVLWDLNRLASDAGFRERLVAIALDLGLAVVAIAGLAAMAASYLTSRTSVPLKAMGVRARAIGAGDVQARLAPSGPSDVSDLAWAVNEALDALARRERRVLQSEQMHAVQVILGGVSHQVNNPLTVLLLNQAAVEAGLEAQVARAEAGPGRDALARSLQGVRRNRDSLARLKRLVESLRELSPASANRGADVHKVVQGCLLVLQHRTMHRRDVVTELASTRRVAAPGAELAQALIPLLLNAVESTGPEGRVALRLSEEDGFARIDVTDDGPGIPESLRSQVFQPFFSTKPGAAGLGLALARETARRRGGDVLLQSGPGGTTATLRLPLEA